MSGVVQHKKINPMESFTKLHSAHQMPMSCAAEKHKQVWATATSILAHLNVLKLISLQNPYACDRYAQKT